MIAVDKRPERIVVLLGAKLIGLDAVLPIIMALRAEDQALDIRFVFLNASAIPTVSANYALDSAMRDTGTVEYLSSGKGGAAGKMAAGWRLARHCVLALVRPAWIFSYTDVGQFPLAPLARAARLGGGKVLIYAKSAYPGGAAELAAHQLKPQRQNRDVRFADPGDAFLMYHRDQAPMFADFGLTRPTLIGTPRQYREWGNHLDAVGRQIGLRDAAGERIETEGRPIIAVFYSGDVEIPTQVDQPRESLRRILDFIARSAPGAAVLIKPHPNCDLTELRGDIASSARPDAKITFAHPQILARAARVTVFNNGSNAINDVYAEGTCVIETSVYTREILAHGPSLFPNAGRIDGSDDDAFDAALRAAATAPEDLPKPCLDDLVSPRPDSIIDTIMQAGARP